VNIDVATPRAQETAVQPLPPEAVRRFRYRVQIGWYVKSYGPSGNHAQQWQQESQTDVLFRVQTVRTRKRSFLKLLAQHVPPHFFHQVAQQRYGNSACSVTLFQLRCKFGIECKFDSTLLLCEWLKPTALRDCVTSAKFLLRDHHRHRNWRLDRLATHSSPRAGGL